MTIRSVGEIAMAKQLVLTVPVALPFAKKAAGIVKTTSIGECFPKLAPFAAIIPAA
jgi:hypothetical protein